MVSSWWYNSNRANLLEYTCVVISTRDAHQNGTGWLVTRCEPVLWCMAQTWGQAHEYLYLSTFKYTFQSTCTLLKYFLISAGVLVLIPKYYVEYLYVLGYL